MSAFVTIRATSRRSRSPEPHASGDRRRHPPRVLRGERRHRDDEHVHGDAHRPGRLRARGGGGRDEPRGRTHRAQGCGRVERADARQTALRRGLGRAVERLALALAARRRARVPRGDVRSGSRRLRGADRGVAGRGCRPAHDRDGLRHPERQGRARRCAGRRAGAPALDLVHRDRPQREEPLRPDGRGVLDLGRARPAADRRGQLLARRDRDAAVHRGALERRLDVGLVSSERRAPERARTPRRAAGRHEPLPAHVRRGRPRERRGRLLRDDPRAHARDRPRGPRAAAAADPRGDE